MAARGVVVKALDQHEDALAKLPNVVGLGVVDAGGAPAVGVYVVKKVPEDALPAGAAVPKSLVVKAGGKTVRVPTRVIEQGAVTKEGAG